MHRESSSEVEHTKYLLDTDRMLPGDIILTANDTFTSKGIRTATGCAFSHAILYVGNESYIHSDTNGVHSGNPQRLIFDSSTMAKVLRLRESNNQTIKKICMFSRSEIGKTYSKLEAVKSKALRNSDANEESNRQFCSRLVAQAYAFAGIFLVKNTNYCYPKDIEDSSLIYEVENCLRTAGPHEIEFALSENPLEIQIRATNQILAKARQISGEDIQNFEQLANLIISHPEFDDEISSTTTESGYLTLWQIDYHRNQWRYNEKEFLGLKLEKDSKISLAISELSAAEEQLAQYKYMLAVYVQFWQRSQLRYLALEITLYQNLVHVTTQRVAAAKYVLDKA